MSGRVVRTLCTAFLLLSACTLTAADSSYTIREGETVYSIAKKVDVPVDVLAAFNGIVDAAKLKAGMVIRVPLTYTVKKGDTLYGISRQHSVPLSKLLDLNRLDKDARIKVGQKLFIPVESTAATAPPAAASASAPVKDAQGTPSETAVKATASTSAASLVWPHAGQHEPYKGRISGLVFYGAAGDAVHSASAGEVEWATFYWSMGKVVIIRAADGTLFLYGGNSEILVNVGDRVKAGAEIARLGPDPQGGRAKLIFCIRDAQDGTIDPEKYFSAKSQT